MARLAILGTGKIGESLLSGLRSSGWDDVVVTGRREERVAELREQTVVPEEALEQVVAALRAAHPYEEPAFDVYRLA